MRPAGRPLPAIAAIVLIPWTIGLATHLPHRTVAYHWNIAWAGLDAVIAIGLALTSWLSRRQDTRAALTATATATLMCTDAWFDLCTSAPGHPFAYAAAEAAAELVIAAACIAVGVRTRRDADERVPDDLPRPGERAAGRAALPPATPGHGPM